MQEIDRDQRFITRITEKHILTLDRSDNSLTIQDDQEEEMHLRSMEIADMVDLLQLREPRPTQQPFPQIDWSQYDVATFATYRQIAVYHLTAERLIEESVLDPVHAKAYELTLSNGEKAEMLYFPFRRRLGISRNGLTYWQRVESVDVGVQAYINASC